MRKFISAFLCGVIFLMSVGCNKQINKESPPSLSNDISIKQPSNYDVLCIANDLIFKANKIFFLFYSDTGLYSTFGEVSETTDKQGIIWHSSKYCPTIQQLKNLAHGVFCDEYCEDLFNETIYSDNPKFKEIDGTLYESTNMGGVGDCDYFLMNTMSVQSYDDEQIVVKLINAIPPQNGNKMRTFIKISIIKENGKWLIKSYPFEKIEQEN